MLVESFKATRSSLPCGENSVAHYEHSFGFWVENAILGRFLREHVGHIRLLAGYEQLSGSAGLEMMK